MLFNDPDRPLLGLGLKWVRDYTEYWHSVLAVRSLLLHDQPIGFSQDLVTDKIRNCVETADSLHAHGFCPVRLLAGSETVLWWAALQYLRNVPVMPYVSQGSNSITQVHSNLERCQSAWRDFTQALVGIPEQELILSPVLDPRFLTPEGLPHLFGRWTIPPIPEKSRELGRKHADPLFVSTIG